MKLIKTKLLSNGISASCWKITRISVDVVNLKTTILVELFLNDNAVKPIGTIDAKNVFNLPVDPQMVDLGTMADAYQAVLYYASTVLRAAAPAVDAADAELDEDGNIITPAVVARAAVPAKYGNADLFDAVLG